MSVDKTYGRGCYAQSFTRKSESFLRCSFYIHARSADFKRRGDIFDHLFNMIFKLRSLSNYRSVDIYYLKTLFPECFIVKSTPYFCEISHLQANKCDAVKFLQQYYGLKDEEVLTIGDQNNDIALLQAGGVRVAMGNATPELKEIATYITDTVDNGGWIKAVEKFVKN